MKKTILIALFALMALALVACGGSSEPATTDTASSNNFSIQGQDIAFDVTELRATANSEITINFTNAGTLEHNWILLTPGIDPLAAVESDAIAGADAGILAGGESVTFSFSAPPAGTYDYVCTVEGHAAAGMVGKMIIE
jgi:plastocyanin